MSSAFRFAPRYTIEDYRQWRGDWELWDGIAIAMTPSPFGQHQNILAGLLTCLRVAIERQGCEATALSELDWIVRDDTVVRPDIVVICDAVPDKHLESPPALVAEILSPSTRRNDLTYKRELYAAEGVQTYLIIDPDSRTVEQLMLTPLRKFESVAPRNPLSLSVCDDCILDIDTPRLFR